MIKRRVKVGLQVDQYMISSLILHSFSVMEKFSFTVFLLLCQNIRASVGHDIY